MNATVITQQFLTPPPTSPVPAATEFFKLTCEGYYYLNPTTLRRGLCHFNNQLNSLYIYYDGKYTALHIRGVGITRFYQEDSLVVLQRAIQNVFL